MSAMHISFRFRPNAAHLERISSTEPIFSTRSDFDAENALQRAESLADSAMHTADKCGRPFMRFG